MSATASNDGEPNSTPGTTRRGAIACRRCRRLRSKCLNDNGDGVPPCRACRLSGTAAECVFLRGNSVIDRKDAPRPRKRQRCSATQEDVSGVSVEVSSPIGSAENDTNWRTNALDKRMQPGTAAPREQSLSRSPTSRQSLFPRQQNSLNHTSADDSFKGRPVEPIGTDLNPSKSAQRSDRSGHAITSSYSQAELVEAVEVYFSSFYQVGFLHRSSFLDKVRNNPASISPFLIHAIFSLTAGASSSLVKRYGGTSETARRFFKDKAMTMLAEQCLTPSLECIQAFYLLSLNDWGTGCGPRSWMLAGMGLRMVELLQLERSETYRQIGPSSSEAEQIAAESSRRTVWSLLIADDSLAVGFGSTPTPKLDVTIQTPCEEDDWEFASIPSVISPESASRSIMGNTISAMSLWSQAARWAATNIKSQDGQKVPWDPMGEYANINRQSLDFLNGLSGRLKFSSHGLSAHRKRQTDMALVHLHLLYHGTHILLRRKYLPVMSSQLDPLSALNFAADHGPLGASAPQGFWQDCADVMCRNAYETIRISVEYMESRKNCNPKGFTPLMCFALFFGGTIMCHLKRWAFSLSEEAGSQINAAIDILGQLSDDIPVTLRWQTALQQLDHSAARGSIATAASQSVDAFGAPVLSEMETTTESNPGQGDPLSVLAGLAVSQPVAASATSSTEQISLQRDQVMTNANGAMAFAFGGLGTTDPFMTDFNLFDSSSTELADLFAFPQYVRNSGFSQ